MSNRLFRILYISLFIIIVFHKDAHAQEKKISYIDEGESAPFSGVLLTPEAFAELKIKSETKDEELKVHIDYQVNLKLLDQKLAFDNLKIKYDFMEQMYKDRLLLKDDQIDRLYKDLEKASKKTIWEKIDGPGGFILGTVFSIGVFYVHSKLVNYSLGLPFGQ